MSVVTKNLTHLYESVGLYDAIYNRHLGYKMGEAGGFAKVLESLENRPKSILELYASGNSRHKDFFKLQYHYWSEIETYMGLDLFLKGDPNVICADVGTGDYGRKFDSIFAFYYGASSAVDPNNSEANITMEYTSKIFSNVLKHLEPGGTFVMDACTDGYNVALGAICDEDEDMRVDEVEIELGDSLRYEVAAEGIEIRDTDTVELKTKVKHHYDRMTANNVDTFKYAKVLVNGKTVLRFKIEKPFCQRYFSEPEIVQMLLGAGFADIDFWCCDYEGADYENIGKKAKPKNSFDLYGMMPSVFVAYAPGSKPDSNEEVVNNKLVGDEHAYK